MNKTLILLFVMISLFALPHSVYAQAIIIDHTNTDISKIPDEWITQAKSDLHIAYQHTLMEVS